MNFCEYSYPKEQDRFEFESNQKFVCVSEAKMGCATSSTKDVKQEISELLHKDDSMQLELI